ncbi:MAG: hypothetical protein JNK78_10775 [Planctomycetes bacterium]|nr:hypothetical protein [Planctomycetota bacterium]
MVVPFRDHRIVLLAGAALTLAACGSGPDPGPANRPPAIGEVRDGMSADIDTQEQRSALFANWDPFVDPEGDWVTYEWCIGRTAGRDDVMPWTNVGGAERAAATGLDLPIGVTLRVGVRATDRAGNTSAIATSDGLVIGATNTTRTESPVRAEPPPRAEPRPIEPAHTEARPPEPEPPARTEPARTETPPPVATKDEPPAPAPKKAEPVPVASPEPARTGGRAAITRFGITWTFARPVECGQFVTGDWWVAGPCEIVAIEPASTTVGGRTTNGSAINPDPRSPQQSYDSAMFGPDGAGLFDPGRNVARDVSRARSLRLEPGSSLVSTISAPQAGQLPQLETCAVLTCLPTTPPENAFRPPYCGRDKQCRWLAANLDLGKLARLAPPQGAPAPADLLPRFERTWLDHVGGWTGRFLHPRENMPDYGRDIADLVGTAALVLQLDHPDEEKRPLAIALAQIGIDLAGIVQNGGRFVADGGSGSGRKFPVLFAATVLRDRNLLALVRDQKLAFAEDAQTFHVEQTSPGVWNRGHGDYGPDDAGLAEWGNQHADDPAFDKKSWTADPFRRCCTANAWHGFVLATRIMGLREDWGHPALFDYVDRYMQTESPGTYQRSWSPFAEAMWDRYRTEF